MKTKGTYYSKKVGQIEVECESHFITIRTNRLILKSHNQHDREYLIAQTLRLMSSPENTELFCDGHAWDEGKVIALVDKSIGDWNSGISFGILAVHDKDTDEFMGNLQVENNPNEFFLIFRKHKNVVEIGYILDKKYWGKGYGTEIAVAGKKYIKHMIANNGFENIENPLEEIVATAHPENHGSKSILIKTLKRQEEMVIIRYGQPRMFFYKPLKDVSYVDSAAIIPSKLDEDSISNLSL